MLLPHLIVKCNTVGDSVIFADFTDKYQFIMTDFNFNEVAGMGAIDTGHSNEIVIDSTFFFEKILPTGKFQYSPPPFKMYYWRAYYTGNLIVNFGKYQVNISKFEVYNLKRLYEIPIFDALMGEDVFENKITIIDYDKNKIAFVDTLSIDNTYIALPMHTPRKSTQYNQKFIKIDGFKEKSGNTKSGFFLLDFGTSGGGIILKRDFAKDLSLDIKKADILPSFHNLYGKDYRWRVDSLKTGNLMLNNVPVRKTKYAGFDRLDALEGGDGLLGLALLKRFNMILDYKNNILYIKPNKYFKDKNK